MSYIILTESSANLPKSLVQKYEIAVVPMEYSLDGERHICRYSEELGDGKAFYYSLRNRDIKTSQVNPQRYVDLMEEYLSAGKDILSISLSSGISGTFDSACIAAKQMMEKYPDRKVRTVDSLGASLGEGLIVLHACKCREQGMSVDEAADEALALVQRLCQVFIVDDLYYLKKNGRITGATAFVANLLDIKPLLKGNEKGQIVMYGKARGRKRAIAALAERYEKLVTHPEKQRIAIAHAGCPQDAETLIELLKKNKPPKEVLTVCYEPVTGVHVGPGTLALFFEGKAGTVR